MHAGSGERGVSGREMLRQQVREKAIHHIDISRGYVDTVEFIVCNRVYTPFISLQEGLENV